MKLPIEAATLMAVKTMDIGSTMVEVRVETILQSSAGLQVCLATTLSSDGNVVESNLRTS